MELTEDGIEPDSAELTNAQIGDRAILQEDSQPRRGALPVHKDVEMLAFRKTSFCWRQRRTGEDGDENHTQGLETKHTAGSRVCSSSQVSQPV